MAHNISIVVYEAILVICGFLMGCTVCAYIWIRHQPEEEEEPERLSDEETKRMADELYQQLLKRYPEK